MRIKEGMINITERLHEMYPGKHIEIVAFSHCFDHDKARYAWGYKVYVEDTMNHIEFKSLRSASHFIKGKQIDAEGEPKR